MTTFLILAGGASTRFDGDKLSERFSGYTLPQYCAKFALANGAERICVTLSSRQIYTDGLHIFHRLLDDLHQVCEPEIALQPDDKYGTGVAVSIWQQRIMEDCIILFGDNFYSGSLPPMNGTDTLYYSTVTRKEPSMANLQLALVQDGFVIEKPHSSLRGRFFAGFVKMPASMWNVLPGLKRSGRNEYEITDIINRAPHREAIDLSETYMIWDAITYASDVERIQQLLM